MGHDSHGIGMLPRYAAAYLQGGLKPNTHVQRRARRRRAAAPGRRRGLRPGDRPRGDGAGHRARARSTAAASSRWATRTTSGASAPGPSRRPTAGLVSMHFVNVISRAIVAPFGGSDARFGTNPFCAGVPLHGPRAGDPGFRHQRDRAGQDARGDEQGRAGAARPPDRRPGPADAGAALHGGAALWRAAHHSARTRATAWP